MDENDQKAEADGLITQLHSDAVKEAAVILSDGEAEAAEIIRRAYKDAASKMHDVVENLRSSEVREMSQLGAGIKTDKRRLRQTTDAAAIGQGLPLIRDALIARWEDASARRQWCLSVLQVACQRLTPEHWKMERPVVWSSEDEEDIAFAILIRTGVEPDITLDKTAIAGIRIWADNACLDGTEDAMLADPLRIGAMFLSALEKSRPKGSSDE